MGDCCDVGSLSMSESKNYINVEGSTCAKLEYTYAMLSDICYCESELLGLSNSLVYTFIESPWFPIFASVYATNKYK